MSWCLIQANQVLSQALPWDFGVITAALAAAGVVATVPIQEPLGSFDVGGIRLSKMTDPVPVPGKVCTQTQIGVVNGEGVITKTWGDPPPLSQDDLIDAAWADADAHYATFDSNSKFALLSYAMDPGCPAWRRARIQAVQVWGATLWAAYDTTKTAILAGAQAKYDPSIAGDCPYTIWQIRSES